MFAARSQFYNQPVSGAAFGNSALFPSATSDQYLSVPGSTNLVNWKSTTGFTIEYWFYSADTAFPNTIQCGPGNSDGGGTNYWTFGPRNGNRLEFYYWGSGTSYFTTEVDTLSLNTWNNVSMVATTAGSSTTVRLYINGICKPIQVNNTGVFSISQSVTNGVTSSGTGFGMGKYGGQAWKNFWMDNLRVSNINRYSGDSYTLATAPFTTDANTQLLFKCDNAVGSTVFTDGSSFNRTFTNFNNRVTVDSTRANHT